MLKKILYIGLIGCFIGIFAQAQSTILYSTDNQISSSLINDIYQDKEGFIWISTEYGLNRFDGNKFITYNHIDEDSTSLCNDYIHQTFEDSKGNLWVSSMTGLMKYDRNTNSFTPIPLYRNQLQVFSGINHREQRRNIMGNIFRRRAIPNQCRKSKRTMRHTHLSSRIPPFKYRIG